jgi:hypothetical protein
MDVSSEQAEAGFAVWSCQLIKGGMKTSPCFRKTSSLFVGILCPKPKANASDAGKELGHFVNIV